MTRKDYVAIARALNEQVSFVTTENARYVLAAVMQHTADVFAADNPRFDRDRFMAACGFWALQNVLVKKVTA